MADKRIADFATLEEAQDDDLLLVSSEGETYNMKFGTFKTAVQGDADRAAAAAEAAKAAAQLATGVSDEALKAAEAAEAKAQDAKTKAAQAAANAQAAAQSANSAQESAARSEQALLDATEAVASVNEFAKDFNNLKTTVKGKVDDAYVEDGYLYMTADDEVVVGPLGPFSGGGGGGGGDAGSLIRIVNKLTSRAFSVMNGATVEIKFNWTSTDTSDEQPTGDGSATWRINGTKVATQAVSQGDCAFDVTKYLTPASANTIKLTIEDAYGNSKSFTWTVTVSTYDLAWNLGTLAFHGSSVLTVRLTPTGEGTKTIHMTVDGTEAFTREVTTTGRSVTATIDPTALELTHGAHTVEAWLEVTAGGEVVTTTHLRHVGIWTKSNDNTPVIAVYQSAIEIQQFATGSINYMVYDPTSTTATVRLLEGYNTLSTLTVDRTIQTWAYRATTVGTINLSIHTGESVVAPITVTCTSLGYDINPVTTGLAVDLDPTGHSNSETTAKQFGYKDGDGTNHPLTFSSNFDWINGGFQIDTEGVTGFVVKRGTYVQLDRSLFSDNAATSGKEIKVVFKATNVRDYDAEFLTCVSGGIGLKLQAQQAVFSSELTNVEIPYCEDRKIELDVSIEASNENKLAVVWLEGVPSRAFAYTANDNWMQSDPQNVKIGSDDCDIWIYRLKMYSHSLTRYEILDNFVADCGNTTEMVARYLRNHIFNTDGSINVNELAAANPTLRILKIGADRMTVGKSDEVVCMVDLVYTDGGSTYNFHATGVIMKGQGTSSAAYGEAALNLDLDFSKAIWENGAGERIETFAMTENDIPVSYFNIKLNVASSENANNTVLADDYNNFQPFLSEGRRADTRVRDTVKGYPCAVFFTNTGTNAVSVGARSVGAGATILYGNGDMNNSKKNFAVFGQTSQRPLQCCVEISNNIASQCLFKSADLTAETWDGNGAFEFRYPKKPTAEMKTAFQTMLSWVVSTDTTAPTGNALSAPVTYDGTTYTNDTKEYRAAKFKAEVGNYFTVDSLLYHYLFTERHCMIDNRAKNVFISYEYDPDVQDYRWNVCKDYDNDTADGNDNEGGLTFSYGLEDTDSVGTKPVFNASSSVLWCNVRDCLGAELEAMFKDREAAGAWSAERILAKFAAHQAARPEALVAEDMWGKYFMPYINNGNTAYIDMMQGNKTDQRTQFETYQEGYMSSKYYGSVAVNDKIQFRGNTPNEWAGITPTGNFSITPYADCYIIVKYGSYSVRKRAKRGTAYEIICPVQEALSDTEIYVYLASNVVEISSIAGLYCQFIDLQGARRLRSFTAGAEADGYTNKNLTSISVGANTLLEYLDLRGTPELKQALDLSALTSLKTLLLTGSGITGVTFALGAPVETAKLCPLNSLIARQLSHLTAFAMDGSNLRTVWVEDAAAIDTYALVSAAASLSRGRLPDVDWSMNDADVLLRLKDLAGLDEMGNPATEFVLKGAAHIAVVSQAELTTIMARFLNLSVTYDQMVSSCTVTFKNYDGTVLNTQTVRKYGAAKNPVTAGLIDTPVKPSTVDKVFTFIGWDQQLTYILEDLVVTAQYSEATRYYTVRWYNGTQLLQTDTVAAHDGVSFRGGELTSSTGSIWMGWDALTNDVTSDIDVHAVFITPTLPDTVATNFDYLYSDDANDNSGYTLAEFYGIMETGKAKDYFAVGDKIKIVPTTTVFADTSIIMQVAGFNHFKKMGGDDFAGVVFTMLGIMNATHQMNSQNTNVGGWASCGMRTWLNETIFAALPRQWQSMIKVVQVRSSVGDTKADISISNDRLFLLSRAEVGFNVNDVPYKDEVDPNAENVTFALFTDNNSRIKKTYNGTGSASNWWLRSPEASSSSSFAFVLYNGGSYINYASNSYGVAFGFCI